MTDHPGAGDLPGLYVHVPFCLRKCGYCGFFSVTGRELIPDFLTALGREAALCGPGWGRFDTLHIGGGTPSLLAPNDLARLIDSLRAAFTITPAAEIAVEVNPGDVDPPYLRTLRSAGVNRLTIGCQSFDDALLAFLGRRHTARQARDAVEAARAAGFANIGIDLIFGIPGQSADDWQNTLATACSLRPDHLSCYQLTIEAGTPFGRRHDSGEIALPGDETQADLFLATSRTLADNGFLQYEVSNFTRSRGTESRHNKKYWRHTPYLGLGPAAHSFDGRIRSWNVRSVEGYIAALKAGRLAVAESEQLTPEQLRTEALFLGMRTSAGVDLGDFRRRFGQDLLGEKADIISRLGKEGLVEVRDGFIRPTRAGMAVADSLALI
ncbi:MAG: radical SAM family heme chaperone HemW [Syntrophales bacterium]